MTASHSSSVMLKLIASRTDAGVVDENVEPAVGVDGLLDERPAAVPRRDVVAVRGGRAAVLGDLGDHLAGLVAIYVVHDDAGAFGREQARMAASDAAARAAHDGNLAFEQAHGPGGYGSGGSVTISPGKIRLGLPERNVAWFDAITACQ